MRTTRASIVAAAVLAALVLAAGPALAATSGTSDVILQANATVQINIVDASITLSPGQGDYETGYVSAEGASGIDVQIRTNSSTGAILKVKCADASPQIALADVLFKTQTLPGGGGSRQATYTAITASDQDLWSTTTTSSTYTTIQTDIRVQNLWDYSDPGTPGTTARTNTLTYTIVVQ
jgi:hypothetical protein